MRQFYHDWILLGIWGVVFGFSKCRRCGRESEEDRLYEECKGGD